MGLIMGEGSFNVKRDGSFNFTLKESDKNITLFKYIAKNIIETTTTINENKGFLQIKISSKKEIKKIIKLIDSNISLRGLKLKKYTEWKGKKKKSERYKDCLDN
jgi:hypothetical protein